MLPQPRRSARLAASADSAKPATKRNTEDADFGIPEASPRELTTEGEVSGTAATKLNSKGKRRRPNPTRRAYAYPQVRKPQFFLQSNQETSTKPPQSSVLPNIAENAISDEEADLDPHTVFLQRYKDLLSNISL
jgi:hypothetical protein